MLPRGLIVSMFGLIATRCQSRKPDYSPMILAQCAFSKVNKAKRRFAIITYDVDRLASLSWQVEGNSFAHSILRGLNGFTYAKERGIINITVFDQVPALPAPNDDAKR
jgi:hypothetical protein